MLLRRALLGVACTADALTARTAPRRRRIQLSAAKDDGATLPGATYEIIHEDDDILVVDKGAGLLFVPGRQPHKHDSLISRVRATHGDAVSVAHRLDRDTSGVCVLAKTKAALRALSIQFQERRVTKTYVGAVAGVPDAAGVIEGAIGKILTPEGHHRVALLSEAAGGRAASTVYRVLDTASDSSLLELEPTWRIHIYETLPSAGRRCGDRGRDLGRSTAKRRRGDGPDEGRGSIQRHRRSSVRGVELVPHDWSFRRLTSTPYSSGPCLADPTKLLDYRVSRASASPAADRGPRTAVAAVEITEGEKTTWLLKASQGALWGVRRGREGGGVRRQ